MQANSFFRTTLRHLLVTLFLLFIPGILLCEPTSHGNKSVSELINQLQSGGLIIYLRHGATDRTQKDSERDNLEDCTHQRNLSDLGRRESIAVGKAIRAHQIGINKIMASPYCRTRDTAQLIFGRYEINNDLAFSISKNKQEAEYLGQRLKQMMLQADTASGNAVFVGHTSNLKDGLGIWPAREGVAVIFKKHSDKLILLGQINPDQWPTQQ